MSPRAYWSALGLALLLVGAPVEASAETSLGWITLGTNGGPYPDPARSEPANALLVDGRPWLVDCGDGAVERLSAAGFAPVDVKAAFISHLHMDHIGGLQGLIGLRWMMGARTPITIYGPPGIEQVVAGLVASLEPSVKISQHEAMGGMRPQDMVKVVTLSGDSALELDGVKVRTVRNSHFDEPPGHPLDNGSQSLSYRFDHAGRSIAYTGDTGPSPAVVRLAQGADVLFSEVTDRTAMVSMIRDTPMIPAALKPSMIGHFETQHLSPQEAGKIAADAKVKRLVITHIASVRLAGPGLAKLGDQVRETYKGDVTIASDLDRF